MYDPKNLKAFNMTKIQVSKQQIYATMQSKDCIAVQGVLALRLYTVFFSIIHTAVWEQHSGLGRLTIFLKAISVSSAYAL